MGFVFYFESSVTLEEDLRRRDFTINSIAKDQNGRLIDPYNGIEDLERKIFRHTSPAFAEDPLRVLRFARFKSYEQLHEFNLHKETAIFFEEVLTYKVDPKTGLLSKTNSKNFIIEAFKPGQLPSKTTDFDIIDKLKEKDIVNSLSPLY